MSCLRDEKNFTFGKAQIICKELEGFSLANISRGCPTPTNETMPLTNYFMTHFFCATFDRRPLGTVHTSRIPILWLKYCGRGIKVTCNLMKSSFKHWGQVPSRKTLWAKSGPLGDSYIKISYCNMDTPVLRAFTKADLELCRF